MADPAVLVRAAASADADLIVEFNLAMARETEHRELDHDVVARGVRRVLADATLGLYFIAERGGQRVGQLMLTREFSDWRDGLFWWIQSVYVRPDARRVGVYAALHRHVEHAARTAGDVCGLRLYVERDNAVAHRTYARLGMSPTSYALFEVDWRQ